MRRGGLTITILVLTGLSGALQTSLSAQEAQQRQAAGGIDASWLKAGGVKTVLYHWANHMGMLRGLDEQDRIATLEYVGTGTIELSGQPCKLTRYRAEINYQMQGMRADFACTLPNGQNREEIQVVAGQYAWNETGGPGAGLVPGKGTAVPMMSAHHERAIRLWSVPQGAVKAAVMGGENTRVEMEGGKTVVTYPIPGVSGAMARATLMSGPVEGVCRRNCAERIEVRQANVVTEFTYSNYADYNHPEEQLDAFFPGRIIEKRGTQTILDLTVTRTNLANYYIVVPVPPGVRNAAPAAGRN